MPISSNDQPMIFIAGLPRSGTTLLQSILSKSPLIYTFPETHYFEVVSKLELWDKELTDANIEEIGKGLIERSGVEIKIWKSVLESVNSRKHPTLTVKELFLILVENYRRNINENANIIPLEKTPGHIFDMERILKLYPNSRILLMRRNPRDYASSMKKCYWAPGTIFGISELWNQTIKLIHELNRKIHVVKVVDYEDLVTHPENVLNEVFNFLKLPFEKKFLENVNSNIGGIVIPGEKEWKNSNLKNAQIITTKKTINLDVKSRMKVLFHVLPTAIRYYGLSRVKI